MPAFLRILKIAWRNLFRNKRRSLLTLMVLMLGSTGMLLVGGYFNGILWGFRELLIHGQTGHLRVSIQGYRQKGASEPYRYLLNGISDLREKITALPHVTEAFPRLQFGGLVNNGQTQMGTLVLATDSISEARMGNYQFEYVLYRATDLAEGKDLDPKDPYGVVVGKGLSETLGLKLGDTFSLLTTLPGGALEGADLHVRGIFSTILKDYDERILKMDLSLAQKLLKLPEQAHTMVVVLDRTEHLEAGRRNLEKMLGDGRSKNEVYDWSDGAVYYHQSEAMLNHIFRVVQIIVAVVFFFNIANVLNMSLMERTREFGTMMAMGNSRRTVFLVVLLEASFLGLLGVAFGLGFGALSAETISALKIQMAPLPQTTQPYFLGIELYPTLMLETAAICFFSTLLAAFVPAWRMSHFPIVRALEYV